MFVFGAVALPWFLLLSWRVGPGAMVELIGHYTVGRYTGVIENQRGPWFYYLPVVVLGFFPWIAFVPVAFARAWQSANDRDAALLRLAMVWTILPLGFFSVAQTKLPNYIALILPALAIIVGLWFKTMSDGRDRRAAIISAAVVPLTIGCIAFAIIAFGRSNKLALEAVAPQLVTLAVGMLVGSIATVAAIIRRKTRASAPYVLAVTSLLLVLFIVFVGVPVAERLKPIPQMAAIINHARSPGDRVAIRGVSGGNGLVFYTSPGVETIDPFINRSFLQAICSDSAAYIVTRMADVSALAVLTRQARRNFNQLDSIGKTVLLRVDGPHCPPDVLVARHLDGRTL